MCRKVKKESVCCQVHQYKLLFSVLSNTCYCLTTKHFFASFKHKGKLALHRGTRIKQFLYVYGASVSQACFLGTMDPFMLGPIEVR